ncbi:hypothetical protein C0J52_08292, partial [Blattella germanica]
MSSEELNSLMGCLSITAFFGRVNEEESAAPMLVCDVYEVLSSHRPVARRQQKISPSPKRKQPTEGNADSKYKHRL